MDALSVLREWASSGRAADVAVSGGRVRVGTAFDFDAAAPTRWTARKGAGDRLTVGAAAFFVGSAAFADAGARFGDYLKAARDAGVPAVAIVDRKDLTAFLKGEYDGADYLTAAADEVAAPAVPAKRPLEPDADTPAQPSTALAAALSREAPWTRDRNAALLVPSSRGFSKALALAASAAAAAKAAAARAASRGSGGGAPAAPSSGRPARGAIAAVPSRRYERGADGASLADMGLEEYGGLGISAAGGAAARRPRAAAAPADAAAPAPSRPTRTPSSSRRGTKKASSSAGGPPIIIVPSAATAKLNMLNAAAFFGEGRYVSPDDARAAGVKKEASVTVERTVARPAAAAPGAYNPPSTYTITDNPAAFTPDDWKRVVAVVTTGAAWQFKGWPHPGAAAGDTVALFASARGIFIGLADEAPPPAITQWNVKRFVLHRSERHRDRSVAGAVWASIDDFCAAAAARKAAAVK